MDARKALMQQINLLKINAEIKSRLARHIAKRKWQAEAHNWNERE